MNNTQSPHSPDLSLSYYAATPTYSPPQQSPYRSSFSCIPPPHSPYHYHPNAATRQRKTAPRPCMPRGVKKEESMLDADYVPDASVPSMSDANIDLAGRLPRPAPTSTSRTTSLSRG
ncbi:hypothetical protein P3342_008771 [Pyrenophora teres f. teres]|nr:hypothetical protein P3342_008771 [Pyrenophora teres f. teres]